MKKFIFSLERVLEYKRQVLGMKKSELSLLRFREESLERQMEEKNREFSSVGRILAEKMGAGMDPGRISAYGVYLGELNRDAVRLLEQKKQTAEKAGEKQREIVRMNSEIQGLRRLKDRQFSEYSREGQKQQEAFLDEFVGRVGNPRGVKA